MIPYDVGITLNDAERYACPRFRRICGRQFKCHKLDWSDAIELVALLSVIGMDAAGQIFAWGKASKYQARKLLEYDELMADAAWYIRENFSNLTKEDGLAVCRAMKMATRRRCVYPKIVLDALKAYHHEGLSWPKVAKLFGLTLPQVAWATRSRQKTIVTAPKALWANSVSSKETFYTD